MIGIPRLTSISPSAALLALACWGAAPSAAAECACMCVEGIAYEVCTGIITTRSQTQECTEQLQCPAEPEEPADPAEPAGDTADNGLDCRQRQVYRPDLGEYKLHTVCMPAEQAAAHEQLRARRQEMAAKYAERSQGSDHGRGPHQTSENEQPRWEHERSGWQYD